MGYERPHTPITEGDDGRCWCDVKHHCCHILPGSGGSAELCCICGDILEIEKLKNERHGPWAYWLYEPKKVPPFRDVCPGYKTPPADFDLGLKEHQLFHVTR